MRQFLKSALALLCLAFASNSVAQDFTIENIRLDGALRIELPTVLTYINLKEGDTVNATILSTVLEDIYATGFFDDVTLLREANDLIISVEERPAIADVTVEGNKEIDDDNLQNAFESAGLVSGRIYNANTLNKIRQELENVYFSIGRYGIKMKEEIIELPRNRVDILLTIEEGKQAKIKHINIVGNEHFDDETILDEINSGIPNWWSIFSSKDQYEKNKLNGDLETIRSYYFDRGYIDFTIDSTQVSISNDKKDIFVVINVTEGNQYTISELNYAGELILPRETYDAIIEQDLAVGNIFSRKDIAKVAGEIQSALGVEGYPFASIQPVTNIDVENQQVSLVFNVDPQKLTYVNRILFKGNAKAKEEVYRRELRQMENALYNAQQVERSRVRIQRLEYVSNVSLGRSPAADRQDAIDIVYDIEERLSGSFNAGVGVSDNGVSYDLGITQSNFFGTGNALNLNLSQSDTTSNYSISYRNPYYKTDNLSRTLSFNFREFDATDESLSTDYLLDTLGIGATYGMPLSESTRISFGMTAGYNDILPVNLVNQDANDTSSALVSPVQQIQDYIDINGNKNDYLRSTLSYSIDRRDRRIFASEGSLNQFTLNYTLPTGDIEYYKFSYTGEKYFKVKNNSLLTRLRLRFGEGLGGLDGLPFYEKYLAGGIRSLRGFDSRSIGPLEIRTDDTDPDPLGGDLSTLGSIEWLFGTAQGNTSRVSLFVDFGSVYEDIDSYDSSTLRSSYGVTYNWLTAVGPLVFSYAWPLEQQPEDVTEKFQFTIGTVY